ncbi:PIG-L family deacetylase [Candidatus Woesearchaeota archaeon]|nr:PIG-L family deacetylase [Candidatus Woesearchaeota archaeon]MBW3021872.1 PIG-L family deacetylase [Candidatus Woesearchaeota archaeon]
MSKKILVFCAHSDDQAVGLGGTIAKYGKDGKDIIVIIFSNGASSHPHLKPELVGEIREKESRKCEQVLGIKQTIFFNLIDTKYKDEVKKYKIEEKIKRLIMLHKPEKIFTHSLDDPHVDHRDVYNIVKEAFDDLRYNGELYSFDVWNLWNIRKTYKPKLYVDITDTFKTKLKAMNCFPSQKLQMQLPLTWTVYIKAFIFGLKHHCKYAERFFKIR